MNSKELKTLLAARGIKARVRDFGRMLRVCPTGADWPDREAALAAMTEIAAERGITNCLGLHRFDRVLNDYEICAHKPGQVVRA